MFTGMRSMRHRRRAMRQRHRDDGVQAVCFLLSLNRCFAGVIQTAARARPMRKKSTRFGERSAGLAP
eukprot:gene9762-biopygen21262